MRVTFGKLDELRTKLQALGLDTDVVQEEDGSHLLAVNGAAAFDREIARMAASVPLPSGWRENQVGASDQNWN